MIPVYLVIGLVVSTIQTILTAREPDNRSALESEIKEKRYMAWVLLVGLWVINIFTWLPYLFFKWVVVPLIKVTK